MSDAANWIVVAQIDEIEAGAAKEVLARGRILAIFRTENGWFALDGICPHQGGPLAEGQVHDGCVTCPWHGWQYELATGTHTVSGRPLAETFPIREREGNVEVQLKRES